jgi:hypothetical protein
MENRKNRLTVTGAPKKKMVEFVIIKQKTKLNLFHRLIFTIQKHSRIDRDAVNVYLKM